MRKNSLDSHTEWWRGHFPPSGREDLSVFDEVKWGTWEGVFLPEGTKMLLGEQQGGRCGCSGACWGRE